MVKLGGMLKLEFGSEKRTLTSYFLVSEPGIRIEKEHIRRAMEKRRTGEISDDELYRWAIMVLLNDAYLWEGLDEDEIVDALHNLADISNLRVHNRLD
ncbi:MAG TPA: hypothetical protein VMF56_04120 [Acidobacteriaceae bacterium]|nr:hypothetical protein [Acidobacteriaceae bacterium]